MIKTEPSKPHFVIYNASAGSGKTTKLVTEYLKLLFASEDPTSFKRILAITFTNKAAQEMKERIISYLSEIKNGNIDDHPYLKDMLFEANVPIESQRKKAEIILLNILHHYNDFAVSTIDAFMHRIIRAFARDLALPNNFEVILDEKEFLSQAVKDLMYDLGDENKALTKHLVSFALEQLRQGKSWNIDYHLAKFSEVLLDPYYEKPISKLGKISIDDWGGITKKITKQIIEIENKADAVTEPFFQFLNTHSLTEGSFYNGARGLPGFFKKIKNHKFDKPNSSVEKFVVEQKTTSGKATAAEKELIESHYEELLGYLQIGINFIEENATQYALYKLVQRTIYQLSLLSALEKKVKTKKQYDNQILISDFNKLIAEAIGQEYAPFIYERLGEKYNYLFIDEFQDTSTLQFQNFLPLIENAVSKNHQALLVGDVKQSIYRWRGGEAELLGNFPTPPEKITDITIKKRFENFNQFNIQTFPLNVNRRSLENIITTNNYLFKHLLLNLPENVQNAFSSFQQEVPSNSKGGYVELDILTIDKTESLEQVQLTQLTERIKAVLSRTQMVDGEEIPIYQPKDIAIFARRKQEVSAISSYLTEQKLPVISAEGLLILNASSVKLILAALQYFIEGQKSKEAKATLWVWLKKENQITHNDYTHFDGVNLLEVAIPDFGVEDFTEKSLYEKASYLSEKFGYLKSKNPFVIGLLNQLFEQVNSKQLSYSEFKEWCKEKRDKLSIQTPDGANAISVMTIHKAKGLQFPVVILPFLWWKIEVKNYREWLELSKPIGSLESVLLPISKTESARIGASDFYNREYNKVIFDNLNLLYVALTRAKEEMYLFTKEVIEGNVEFEKIEAWVGETFKGLPNVVSKSPTNYMVGFPTTKRKQKPIGELTQLAGFGVENWKERVKISKRFENEEKAGTAIFKGIVWHEIMSKVTIQNDLNLVVNEFLKKGQFDEEDQVGFLKNAQSIINHQDVKASFSAEARVFNECVILMPNGKNLRPDRVSKIANEWIIIDYKTGLHTSKNEKQVKEYCIALQESHEKVSGFLCYLNTGEVKRVA